MLASPAACHQGSLVVATDRPACDRLHASETSRSAPPLAPGTPPNGCSSSAAFHHRIDVGRTKMWVPSSKNLVGTGRHALSGTQLVDLPRARIGTHLHSTLSARVKRSAACQDSPQPAGQLRPPSPSRWPLCVRPDRTRAHLLQRRGFVARPLLEQRGEPARGKRSPRGVDEGRDAQRVGDGVRVDRLGRRFIGPQYPFPA